MNKKRKWKKLFLQNNVIFYILMSVITVPFAVMGIYGFIYAFNDNSMTVWYQLILIACSIISICVFGYGFFRCCLLSVRIYYTEEEVYTPGERGQNRIQYRTHVKYTDIQDISFNISNNNSKGRPFYSIGPHAPIKYIVFKQYDGRNKYIWVGYSTQKHIARMIDLAKERAALCGNELNIRPGADIVKEYMDGYYGGCGRRKKQGKTNKEKEK